MNLQVFRDENGKVSSTRSILMSTLILFLVCGFADVFTDVNIADQIYTIIQVIFTFGLSSTGLRATMKNFKSEIKES